MVKRPKIKLSSARPNRDKTIHTANANTEKKNPPARPRSEIAAVIFKLLPKKQYFGQLRFLSVCFVYLQRRRGFLVLMKDIVVSRVR